MAADRFYRVKAPDLYGNLIGIDFDAKTIEFRVCSDVPPLAKQTYAIIPANEFRLLKMRLEAAEKHPHETALLEGGG